MRGIISHTFHFMYYLAVCDTNVSPGIYQGHQIPWRAETKPQHQHGGDVPPPPETDKREVGAGCFFPAVIVLAQSSCPGHGCLISSSSEGNISVQARAGAKGAGQFPGKTHFIVIHYPPLKQHIRHSCSAPRQSQTFHRVLLLLYSIQRSLPRLKVR